MTTATDKIKNTSSTATSTHGTEKSIVVTGFGPFGGVEDNPTTVIVRRLDSYLRSSSGAIVADMVKDYIVLETSAKSVNETMDVLRTECADAAALAAVNASNDIGRTVPRWLLLHLGVARSKGFRLESCAYNEATFRIPDQRGYQPTREPIVSNPKDEVGQCYETSLDLEGLKKTIERDFPNISTVVSTNPGRFVCNYVYCKSLEVAMKYSARKESLKSGVDDSTQPPTSNTITGSFNEKGGTKNGENASSHFICESLFLHVPHFSIVPEEEQLAYVAALIKNLAAQDE